MKLRPIFVCAFRHFLALVISSVFAVSWAQVPFSGTTYTQNFDSLPSTGTFTLTGNGPHNLSAAPINASGLTGWTFAKYSGTGTVALFRIDDGTGTSGSIYSYGTSGATDRALGSVGSGTTISRFGVTFVNYTGQTIRQFTLSYTGEQWRRGSGAANKLTFAYAINATDINTGTFVTAPSLDFTAPTTAGSGVVLNGNLAANRTAISATVSDIEWPSGASITLRWTDVDDTGSDDGIAIDDLSFGTDVSTALPGVVSSNPANGAVNVAASAALTVTFNQAVNVTGEWFGLVGSTSGKISATVSGGPTAYTLTPATPFAPGEAVTLTVFANQVTDAATGAVKPASNYTAEFITAYSGPLPINKVQGSGTASVYTGLPVTVRGIVTATFQGTGGIGGYYIEAPDAEWDNDPTTSEGLYIFDSANSVTVGDSVTVTGTVTEFASSGVTETQIATVTSFVKESSGNSLPSAVAVSLPFSSATFAERYEGMRVVFPQTLTVTNNFDYGRFGEISLSNGRLLNPTNVVAPGAPAIAYSAQNKLNQVILDDGISTSYPDPSPWLSSSDAAAATRRTGSTTTGVAGVLGHKFGAYVIEPTATPTFEESNPRVPPPRKIGSLRVAIGNVENLMNGDGAGAGFPTSRGATTFADYQRQLAKVTAGILAISPDIMGITEVENDRVTNSLANSYGSTSMVAQLVASLNAQAPQGTTYAFVDASAVDIVTDVIHNVFIYRVETVELVGNPAMLDSVYYNSLARNPLAQTFREKATGEKLTVCINHFRAKGSAATSAASTDNGVGNNADLGDGQGTNNFLRLREAQVLTTWLATDPTGSGDPDFLVIGDLNAYAKEDPITAIIAAGFVNLTERFEGQGGYSYQFAGEFGHLDHALATPSLNSQVLTAAAWHANSDEPTYYSYATANKSVAQQAINAGTPYRYADHDPVVIEMALSSGRAPWRNSYFGTTDNAGNASDTADPDGDGLTNLVEYALGTNPTTATANATTTQNTADVWTYQFARPLDRTDISVEVVASTDLVNWSSANVTVSLLSQANGQGTFRATYPAAGTSKVFFRLKVTSL